MASDSSSPFGKKISRLVSSLSLRAPREGDVSAAVDSPCRARPAQRGTAPVPLPLPPPPPPTLPISPDDCGRICSKEPLGACSHLFLSPPLSLRHGPSQGLHGAPVRTQPQHERCAAQPLSSSYDVAWYRPAPAVSAHWRR
ncbi:hypothetical protein BDA96_07G054500 [Sorghum bicolor]|uniref:Uncharacterized protein n=2 Tax=Sorghum bicolor TaxID=4558 RepID=A0A921QKW8_SORBI|nr:hypothetical protein BDA96_07G054500 [Sorghum bicolor]KXG24502.1 hypothetical protein SORBI_3007G051600 [Sorghum bicolor]